MSRYACGHSSRELGRLELQATLFDRITRAVLGAAGLRRGMRVLDIGCGAGDVSLLAAELVGPRGSVLGVDRSAAPLATARARARARGLRHVTFRRAAIDRLRRPRVDALVGRFVLMHQRQPARLLRAAARHVRPGGIVVMLESHLAGSVAGVHSRPHSRLAHGFHAAIRRALVRTGAHVDMGLKLRETFLAAGLPEPELWLQARVEGGKGASLPRYFGESLSSLAHEDGTSLERRLRAELEESGGVICSPLVVGAWCRLQASIESSTPRM